MENNKTDASPIFDIKRLREDLITKRVIQLNISLREAQWITGISPATLSRIENSKLPDVETFAKLCIWLDKKADSYFKTTVKKQDGFKPIV